MLLCRNPYMASGGHAYGCGQCMPCRVNHRRVWAHRIMLECNCHPVNSFWTLTYSDENMRLTEGEIPTLEPTDLTNFMKRLREHYYPQKLRYYNVGEYGDQTERPHYHLALFNFPSCSRGITQQDRRGNCCSVCDSVRDIWGLGRVHSGQLEADSAAYICGYITKKWTKKGDERLNGRHPEFARMSLKPGIGAGFIPEVAHVLLDPNIGSRLADVTTSLQHGARVRPLGRYLTRELRKHVGMEPGAPQATLDKQAERLRPLQEMAKETAPKGLYSETLRQLILSAADGRVASLEARSKIFKKRGTV